MLAYSILVRDKEVSVGRSTNRAEATLAKGSDSPFPKAASKSLKLDEPRQRLILHTNIDQPPWEARMRIRCIVFPTQMFVGA
jgi:hypothetical protein